MTHSPRFLQLVAEAKTRVRETTTDEVKARLDRGEKFLLVGPGPPGFRPGLLHGAA